MATWKAAVMNPEVEDQNGQAELLARHDSIKSANSDTGTNGALLSASLTLEPEACSDDAPSTPQQQSPSLKNRSKPQGSHKGDSPKGSYSCYYYYYYSRLLS